MEDQRVTHRGVLGGIALFAGPCRHRDQKRHKLVIYGYGAAVDRRSLQHLVDFLLDGNSPHVVTELEFNNVYLSYPSDGGFEVLRDFFARSNTTLTSVIFHGYSIFGNVQEASQLFAAFRTNRTVTGLTISYIRDLSRVSLGVCLSGLLQNNTTLRRLECPGSLSPASLRALQPSLRVNRSLKELNLSDCHLGDEEIRLVVDALDGNVVFDSLDISVNDMTFIGLGDITRLLESTRLAKIDLGNNQEPFDDDNTTQNFIRALSRSRFLKTLDIDTWSLTDPTVAMMFQALEGNMVLEFLHLRQAVRLDHCRKSVGQFIESLPRIKGLKRLDWRDLEACLEHAEFLPALRRNTSIEDLPGFEFRHSSNRRPEREEIRNLLIRNQGLRRADSLLQPHTHTGTIIRSNSGVWQQAIVQLAQHQFGASAIFHMLQKRPGLLEPRLRRPRAAAGQEQDSPLAATDNGRKRVRRL